MKFIKKATFIFLIVQIQSVGLFSQNKTTEFINRFREKYIQMHLKEDFSIVKQFYSDSIRIMPEFQETLLGLNNSEKYYTALYERFNIEGYNRTIKEILDLGSRVIEIGNFSMKLSDSTDLYELEGKYVNIWKLSSENKLELFTEAWNYNHNIDFEEKLIFKNIPSIRMALEPHLNISDNISFELAGLNALMELTISEKDGKLWSMFYADDGISLHSFSPMNIGRDQLDKYYEEHAKEMPVFEKLDIRTDRIDELDGYVIEYATAIANWRMNEWSGVSTSKNIRIWKRQPNGSLKIFRLIAMYDR